MLLCQVMVRQLQQLQVKSIKAPKYRAKNHQLCVSDAAWLHQEMVYRLSCWVGPLENNMTNLILTSIDILATHLDCWWWALSFCHISRSSPTNDQEIERLLPYTGFTGVDLEVWRAQGPPTWMYIRQPLGSEMIHSEDLPILPDKSTWMQMDKYAETWLGKDLRTLCTSQVPWFSCDRVWNQPLRDAESEGSPTLWML